MVAASAGVEMTTLARLLLVGLFGLTLAACGNDGTALAAEACAPRENAASAFDPETAPLSELERNARVAGERATLAAQAAAADGRWQVLSDAANALAAFAEVLRDARMDDVSIADVTTPDMWDQAKYASDAFLIECRRASQ